MYSVTSPVPRFISSARRKTPRWRRGASRFASRDARASEAVGGRPTILAAERAGGQWNGGIQWITTYTTPRPGFRYPGSERLAIACICKPAGLSVVKGDYHRPSHFTPTVSLACMRHDTGLHKEYSARAAQGIAPPGLPHIRTCTPGEAATWIKVGSSRSRSRATSASSPRPLAATSRITPCGRTWSSAHGGGRALRGHASRRTPLMASSPWPHRSFLPGLATAPECRAIPAPGA